MASSRFRSRLTLGKVINRVDTRLNMLSRNPVPRRLQSQVVTLTKVARDAVTGDNIVEGSITGDNIGSGEVTGDNIDQNTITGDNIQAGTITGDNIQANTITGDQINGRSITGDEIAAGTLTAENIKAGTITATEIAADAIRAEHIAAGQEITSPKFVGASGDFTGIVRATRLVAYDIIGPGDPSDVVDGIPMGLADRISIRPYRDDGVLTSQLDLWTDGHVNITATSFNAFTVNDIMVASRNHKHENFTAHGQLHASTSPSDIRMKTNVEPIAYGLDFIKALKPVQYKMINGDGRLKLDKFGGAEIDDHGKEVLIYRPGKRTHFGLVAQDVQTLCAELGVDFAGHVVHGWPEDPDGDQALRYEQLIAPLVRAVQELSAEVESLRSDLAKVSRVAHRADSWTTPLG